MAETTRRTSGSASAPKTDEKTDTVKDSTADVTPAGPVVVPDTDPEIAAGQSVEETKTPAGYAGVLGFDALTEIVGETKSSRAEDLKRAQILAPHLTQEFVDAYQLDADTVRGIADGQIAPPPAIGPNHTSDLYLTPGGWVQTKPGVKPGESTAISR